MFKFDFDPSSKGRRRKIPKIFDPFLPFHATEQRNRKQKRKKKEK